MARQMTREQTEAYDELMSLGRAGLAPDEFWVISKEPEGPLWDTASKDFVDPVRIFCEALNVDWDVAAEQGYFLAKEARPVEKQFG